MNSSPTKRGSKTPANITKKQKTGVKTTVRQSAVVKDKETTNPYVKLKTPRKKKDLETKSKSIVNLKNMDIVDLNQIGNHLVVPKESTEKLTASQSLAQIASGGSHERSTTEVQITVINTLEVAELGIHKQSTEKDKINIIPDNFIS